jgi:hypothetical protein
MDIAKNNHKVSPYVIVAIMTILLCLIPIIGYIGSGNRFSHNVVNVLAIFVAYPISILLFIASIIIIILSITRTKNIKTIGWIIPVFIAELTTFVIATILIITNAS